MDPNQAATDTQTFASHIRSRGGADRRLRAPVPTNEVTELEPGVGLTLAPYSYRDATDTHERSGSATYLGDGRWAGDKRVVDMVEHRQRGFALDVQDAVLSFHEWSNGYLRGEVTGAVPAGVTVGVKVLRQADRRRGPG